MGRGNAQCLPTEPKEVHSWYQDDLQWHQKENGKKGYHSLSKGRHLLISDM